MGRRGSRRQLRNPDHVSAAESPSRAADARNAYLAEVDLDGVVKLLARRTDAIALCERRLSGLLLTARYKLVSGVRADVGGAVDDVEVARVETTLSRTARGLLRLKKVAFFDDIRVTNARACAVGRTIFRAGSTNGTQA